MNPYDGFAPASIIADTWVELLGVNKQQLNQFTFSRENIEDVRKKAMVQPNTSKVYVLAPRWQAAHAQRRLLSERRAVTLGHRSCCASGRWHWQVQEVP